MRRLIAMLLAASLAGLAVGPASAHVPRSFDACVGRWNDICRDRELYLAGDHPRIEAQVRPHHEWLRAELWRRAPQGTWKLIARVAIRDRGRMTWQWDTTSHDIRRRAWRYQYRLPHHETTSDIVRVKVIAPPI